MLNYSTWHTLGMVLTERSWIAGRVQQRWRGRERQTDEATLNLSTKDLRELDSSSKP